jgi:hypothetical protein
LILGISAFVLQLEVLRHGGDQQISWTKVSLEPSAVETGRYSQIKGQSSLQTLVGFEMISTNCPSRKLPVARN